MRSAPPSLPAPPSRTFTLTPGFSAFDNCGRGQRLWRKRLGVEPSPPAITRAATGFEDREGHRAPFASSPIVRAQRSITRMNAAVSREIRKHDIGSALAQIGHAEGSRRHPDGHDTDSSSARNIMRRVADDEHVFRSSGPEAARARSIERERHERIAIGGVVAECSALEVAPQVEMLELDASAFLEISGEQREEHIGSCTERIEQLCDARHDRLHTLARQQNFVAEECHVGVAQPCEQIFIHFVADRTKRIVQDDPVGPAGDRHAVERIAVTDDLLAGAIHRAHASTTSKHQGAIDIEEYDLRHDDEPIYNRRQEAS